MGREITEEKAWPIQGEDVYDDVRLDRIVTAAEKEYAALRLPGAKGDPKPKREAY